MQKIYYIFIIAFILGACITAGAGYWFVFRSAIDNYQDTIDSYQRQNTILRKQYIRIIEYNKTAETELIRTRQLNTELTNNNRRAEEILRELAEGLQSASGDLQTIIDAISRLIDTIGDGEEGQ